MTAATGTSRPLRLGVDVGGTFTDVVLVDGASGSISAGKTLTTPDDLATGVLSGVDKALAAGGAAIGGVDYIVHGTTIGTNALIERTGARVGLLTTAGFRDVLEIARIERPDAGLYDMNVDLPTPLVPRYLRLEVEERVAADGRVVRPLQEASVRRAVATLLDAGVEAIAVCLLFSFRNPDHERAVGDICAEMAPGVPVSLSSEIAPEFREYERTSTTVINAYLLPVTKRYLASLTDQLQEKYGGVDLRILQASGGAMSVAAAASRAVRMINSGPAGGALATALCGRLAGEDQVLGVDMGGTSFDISLIVGGKPRLKSEGEIEGYPVKLPMIDVEGIGAGGGSIAWVDAGGALNVGPQSAGADPGPACYGHGGAEPTVTDAHLALGRLNPDYFLGAEMALYPEAAKEAISRHVAEPLGLSVEEAAAGIIRVVNANMVRGIRGRTTQKGYDVREFAMVAFGGAGPLHAVELASEVQARRVLIPPYCSVFSALGAVSSDIRHDYVRTVALPQAAATAAALEAGFAALEKEARHRLAADRVQAGAAVVQRAADLRYEGQSYEIAIPMGGSGHVRTEDVSQLIADFHRWHERIYAYGDPEEAVEVVNLRLAAIGRVPPLELERETPAAPPAPVPKGARRVYFLPGGFAEAKVYERDDLVPGQILPGPCLIEEATSTTVIPPGREGRMDRYGNLAIGLEA